jgi:hypothetical protein
MKSICLLLMLAGPAMTAAAQAVTPDKLAHRARLELSGAGPYYQLGLPLDLYQGVQRKDLGDVRVFNSQGETVPHALVRREPVKLTQSRETVLPVFPITSPRDNPGNLSLEVQRNQDGSLISIRQTTAPQDSTPLVRGAVLDASRIDSQALRSLRLAVGPASTAFHPFTLDTSDDLQQWQMLKSDAQLVQLEHEGHRITRNSVDWQNPPGKYLRILWRSPEQAPRLLSAVASATSTSWDKGELMWSAPLTATVAGPNTFDFRLPGQMPIERLRIGLPSANTLAPLQLQYFVEPSTSRRHRLTRKPSTGQWVTLHDMVAYRLQTPTGELRSPDVDFMHPPLSRVRLVADTRTSLGDGAPTLQIGFTPQTLVFLGRGAAPYTIAWGGAVEDASLPAPTLIPGYRSDQPLNASPARLAAASQGAAQVAPTASVKPAAAPLSKGVLWGVLLAGVAVLGVMVWQLTRQMRRPEEPDQAEKST